MQKRFEDVAVKTVQAMVGADPDKTGGILFQAADILITESIFDGIAPEVGFKITLCVAAETAKGKEQYAYCTLQHPVASFS
jgi:hypothetical protein